MLRLKVITLGEGGAQPFDAAAGVDEPRADAQRQLVGVVDAILSAELILGENGREINVLQAAFKVWQPALVFVGDVDVIGLGLQCLDQFLAAGLHFALKDEAAVCAEYRQAARGVGQTGRIVVADGVMRDVRADFGRDVGERVLQRHRKTGIDHGALAADQG